MKGAMVVAGLVALGASGCMTAGRGEPVGKATTGPQTSIGSQVSFDHNCPRERVRMIRSDHPGTTVDLDVCGVVRRYKAFGSGLEHPGLTWLDVTSAYPASALPPPLGDAAPAPAAPAASR